MNTTTVITTPLGNLKLSATEDALITCQWTDENLLVTPSPLLKVATEQLNAYFHGKLIHFDVPLAPKGTDFQQSVWHALLKIPYGETCSYRDIATLILNPKAVRAVGSANAKNPLCVFIPCHRVINASGKLGGYSGGIAHKNELLALEGVIFDL